MSFVYGRLLVMAFLVGLILAIHRVAVLGAECGWETWQC